MKISIIKFCAFSNKNVLFGLPEMKYNTYAFMNGFRDFVLQSMDLLDVSKSSILSRNPHEAIFVKRLGRRKIINRREMIKAVAPFLDMKSVVFDNLTFVQQIKYVKEGGNYDDWVAGCWHDEQSIS